MSYPVFFALILIIVNWKLYCLFAARSRWSRRLPGWGFWRGGWPFRSRHDCACDETASSQYIVPSLLSYLSSSAACRTLCTMHLCMYYCLCQPIHATIGSCFAKSNQWGQPAVRAVHHLVGWKDSKIRWTVLGTSEHRTNINLIKQSPRVLSCRFSLRCEMPIVWFTPFVQNILRTDASPLLCMWTTVNGLIVVCKIHFYLPTAERASVCACVGWVWCRR